VAANTIQQKFGSGEQEAKEDRLKKVNLFGVMFPRWPDLGVTMIHEASWRVMITKYSTLPNMGPIDVVSCPVLG
jgi:hypothetical protein